jgi:type I restriction enzyme R subunit
MKRGERKRADYILYYQDNPVAVIEAKTINILLEQLFKL